MRIARRVGLAGALALLLGWAPPAHADQDGNFFSLAIDGRGSAAQTGGAPPRAFGPLACESAAAAGARCEPAAYYGFAATIIAVTATPAPGWEFAGWTLTGPPQYVHYCANPATPTCELHIAQGSSQGEYYYELRARFRALPATTPPSPVATVTPVLTAPVTTTFVDGDGDGVAGTLDCNDASPAVRPGAVDAPQDGVDQDCSGADASAPRIQSPVSYGFNAKRTWSRVNLLTVREVPANTTVELACSGGGCPFNTRTTTVRQGTKALNLLPRLRRAKLRPGTKLTVSVTAPGAQGKRLRFTVRAGRTPTLATRTLPPRM